MEQHQKAFGKRELLLLISVISLAAVFYLVNHFFYAAPAAYVEVSIVNADSEKIVLNTFDLFEDTDYLIITEPQNNGEPNGSNHLFIKNGTAWISEANCPNHDCVKKGKISQNGEMLICIPHRLTVSIVGN